MGLRAGPGAKTSIEDIQRKTAEFYKLDVKDFHSPQRARRVARPRQVAMYLSRKLTTRSLPEIGRRFGGRDHTTVLHACRRIEALIVEDPLFRQEVDFLSPDAAAAGRTLTDALIEAHELEQAVRRRHGAGPPVAFHSRRAASMAFWAPMARARAPSSASAWICCGPAAARLRILGSDAGRCRRRRRRIGAMIETPRYHPFLTAERNPDHAGAGQRLARAGHGALAGAGRSWRGGAPQGASFLGRHEAAAGHCRRPDRASRNC